MLIWPVAGSLQRIDVNAQVLREQLSEGFENAALERSVILLLEEVFETRQTHRHGDGLDGVARQVSRQAIVFKVVRDQNRFADGREQVGAREEVGQIDFAVGEQVAHGDFHQLDDLPALASSSEAKRSWALLIMSMLTLVTGPEASALHQDGPLPQYLRGLKNFAGGPEHRRAAQSQLHELEAHDAVIDVAEFDAGELDHVDLDALDGEVVEQRFEQHFRLVMQEKGAVEQVDAHDAEGFLLQIVFTIEHPDVDDDLAVLIARVGLDI